MGALAPRTRLLCGVAAFAACMVAPAASPEGSLVAVAVSVAWLAACRPPLRVLFDRRAEVPVTARRLYLDVRYCDPG